MAHPDPRPQPRPLLSRRRILLRALGVLIVAGVLTMFALQSKMPQGLGVRDGRLAPCPASPNCVSTQATDPQHRIDAVAWSGDAAALWREIDRVVASEPRTHVVKSTEHYRHVEFRSRWLRFVDDVEFWFDADHQVLHFRSASRVGYSDLGVNRRRMESIAAQLVQAGGVRTDATGIPSTD